MDWQTARKWFHELFYMLMYLLEQMDEREAGWMNGTKIKPQQQFCPLLVFFTFSELAHYEGHMWGETAVKEFNKTGLVAHNKL